VTKVTASDKKKKVSAEFHSWHLYSASMASRLLGRFEKGGRKIASSAGFEPVTFCSLAEHSNVLTETTTHYNSAKDNRISLGSVVR